MASRPVKKPAKKITKKVAKKPARKVAKKGARKVAKTPVKKVAKKVAPKVAPTPARKAAPKVAKKSATRVAPGATRKPPAGAAKAGQAVQTPAKRADGTPVPPAAKDGTGKSSAREPDASAAPGKRKGRAGRSPSRQAAALPDGVAPFPDGLDGTVRFEEPLAKHTTFRIGGPAMVHFQPGSVGALQGALAWAKAHDLPWLVLGLGSNVLIRDGGFRGLVVKIGRGLDEVVQRGRHWKVGAGLATPLLARRTAEAGLEGVQRLIGVPGSVGGGVFMNAGAHGQDFASVVESVTVLTARGTVEERSRTAIAFGYRSSGLTGEVVLGCSLVMAEEAAERVKADMNFVLKKRRDGTPFDLACCGSVFVNPKEETAGRLVERCRLKGRRVGGAEVSPLHGNYIVNRGGASADDVLKLVDIVRTAVFKEYGIVLELEVRVLGVPK